MALLDLALILDPPELQRARAEIMRHHLQAAKKAVEVTTKYYERKLEAVTRSVVRGRLWRAWTSGIGPSGRKLAYEPAGWIRLNSYRQREGRLSRTYGAMEYFSSSGRLRSTTGGYMAVPTKAAGPRRRGNNFMITPGEWEKQTGMKLTYLPAGKQRKFPLLVIPDGLVNARTGVFRRATKRRLKQGRKQEMVVIFILIPERNHGARFSIDRILAGADTVLARQFENEVRKTTT